MSLTDLMIKKTKVQEKVFFLSDKRGLLLEIRPSGGKSWIVRLRINGKEKRKVIGQYPEMSIAEAREECVNLRKMTKVGITKGISFSDVYEEWYRTKIAPLSQAWGKKVKIQMNKHVLPSIGSMEISQIKSSHILSLCRMLETLSADTAQRVCQLIGQMLRFAIAAGYIDSDPTYALRGALKPHKAKHYATITDQKRIAELIRAVDAYPFIMIRLAIKFLMLTFVRPSEARQAEWAEIDIEKAEWRIPKERMKTKRPHIVPLSLQVLQILEQLSQYTGNNRYLFPSARNMTQPISDGTMRIALRIIGYSKEDIVPHGFRAMASTILYENGFTKEVIERQLAHAESNQVVEAYNHAEYLIKRRDMMQWYADYLYNLKANGAEAEDNMEPPR